MPQGTAFDAFKHDRPREPQRQWSIVQPARRRRRETSGSRAPFCNALNLPSPARSHGHGHAKLSQRRTSILESQSHNPRACAGPGTREAPHDSHGQRSSAGPGKQSMPKSGLASRTETLSVFLFLLYRRSMRCGYDQKGHHPSASPAASPTSASLLLTCWTRRTLRGVHAGAGYP